MTTTYPQAPATVPPLARARSRPTVDYSEFVLTYSRAQATSAAAIFGGIGAAVLGVGTFDGAAMIAAGAAGLAIVGAGAVALVLRAQAHADYLSFLSSTTETTYADPPAPSPTVRPFVPSSNGAATIRAGRFSLEAVTWRALFQTATNNNGRLTRDSATKALPRHLYRDWAATLAELQRLGLVDGDARPTAAGWRLAGLPYPNGDEWPAGADSTHARRTEEAHGGQGAGR